MDCGEIQWMVIIFIWVALWFSFPLTKFQTGIEEEGETSSEADASIFEVGNTMGVQWLKSVSLLAWHRGHEVTVLFFPICPSIIFLFTAYKWGIPNYLELPKHTMPRHVLSKMSICLSTTWSLLFILWNPAALRNTVNQNFPYSNSVSRMYFHIVHCDSSLHGCRSQDCQVANLVFIMYFLWNPKFLNLSMPFIHVPPQMKIELSIPHGFCKDSKDIQQRILATLGTERSMLVQC